MSVGFLPIVVLIFFGVTLRRIVCIFCVPRARAGVIGEPFGHTVQPALPAIQMRVMARAAVSAITELQIEIRDDHHHCTERCK
jgi:hypothetical protein